MPAADRDPGALHLVQEGSAGGDPPQAPSLFGARQATAAVQGVVADDEGLVELPEADASHSLLGDGLDLGGHRPDEREPLPEEDPRAGGMMEPQAVPKARVEVATREQEMIQSEVQIITAQNGLKRHLAPAPTAAIWDLTLIPTQLPQVQDLAITLDEAIARAMERRPELEQNRLLREQVEVDREYYRRDGRPTVDLVASLTNTGRAGEVFGSEFVDTDGDGVPDTRLQNVPQPSNPFFGGFGNSWGQVFGFDYINYTLGVSVEIPLRNRANEAERARILIRERRLASQLKNQQQMIIVEVRNAYESIATQRKRPALRGISRRRNWRARTSVSRPACPPISKSSGIRGT